jgi:SNF family Na+-dependent transporter
MSPGLLIKVFGCLAAVLWLLSAVFWALSASIKIRDNMDAFIGDLQRAGRLNTWAAATACAAALASCVVAIGEVFRG